MGNDTPTRERTHPLPLQGKVALVRARARISAAPLRSPWRATALPCSSTAAPTRRRSTASCARSRRRAARPWRRWATSPIPPCRRSSPSRPRPYWRRRYPGEQRGPAAPDLVPRHVVRRMARDPVGGARRRLPAGQGLHAADGGARAAAPSSRCPASRPMSARPTAATSRPPSRASKG